jgi:hypothetical protein
MVSDAIMALTIILLLLITRIVAAQIARKVKKFSLQVTLATVWGVFAVGCVFVLSTFC